MRIYYISIICLISFSIIIAQDTTFNEVTSANLTGVSHGAGIWGDYDNDGDLDILLTGLSPSGGITKIYRNDLNDLFTEMTAIVLSGVVISDADWGDYDNDGDLDIVLIGLSGSMRVSKIYNNNGSTFVEQTSIVLTGVDNGSVDWGDYDNDGDLDLILAGDSGGGYIAKVYRNEGSNVFNEQSSIGLIGTWKSTVAWADYDNDGDLDILLAGHAVGENVTKIYRNDGNNIFSEQTSITLTGVGSSSLDWGDYDDDGDLDIILTGDSGSFNNISKIYRNEGNNSFAEQTSIILPGIGNSGSRSSRWADYDNDGDLDLILTGNSGDFYSGIFRNNGDNTFTEMTLLNIIDVYNSSVDWGDYDNDGDLDLIITGEATGSQRNTKIYKNNSPTVNTLPTVPTNLSAIGDSTSVTLSWDMSTDSETPQAGLKYNIVMGTTSGAVDVASPMSDRSTGYRKVLGIGNTNHNSSWTIMNLAPGTFYWSVQAIDNNFAGSDFSPEQLITLPSTSASWLNQIIVEDIGGAESSQALTFGQHIDGTDSIDSSLGEYEVPPPPPAGIFDARFNLPTNPQVSSLLDYRDSNETNIIWNMTFQPSSAGYPMTFSWDSLSFPEGTLYLKYKLNGSFVFVNMKQQSGYTLSETAITSLDISYRGNCSSVSVNNGWNIISVPLLAEDMSLVNLYTNSTSLAYGYDNGYGAADTLAGGKGYWLKFGADEQIQICGLSFGDTVQVQDGWNMLGVYENDLPVNQVTTTPPGIIATFLFGYDDGYYIVDTLKSGQGYWVRVTEDGVLNLNGGTLAKEDEKQPIAKIEQDWGRIIITDNEGKNVTLYVSDEETEFSRFKLPPMPPSGIFDARYGSGTIVENINSEKIIQISSDKYPITIKADGINISVRDGIGGELLNEVLTNGKEITIKNNKITSILITGRVTGVLPVNYKLSQNFPNPFNPSTTIKFSLPEEVSNVKLSIYNALGEKVAELVNASLVAGNYQYKWNAKNEATGIYIYELRTNNFVSVKKMVLMK